MSLTAIRTALVDVIDSVPDVGHVHERERYAANEAAFRALYLFTPSDGPEQVRGWWVRRTATAEHTIDIGGNAIVNHTWTIRGFMAFNDAQASELIFDGLIDAIRAAVREDPTLGGVCDAAPLNDDDNTEGIQVVDAGPVTFAGVLCHSATLQLKTWSYA